jgi:hypothetical protein
VQEKGHKTIDPNNMHKYEEYKDLDILKILEEKKKNKSKEKEKKK